MDAQQLWQAVLGELEISISKANFTTWFKGTFILEMHQSKIIIGVPNGFTKSWLEKKYTSDIVKSLRNNLGEQIREIEYRVESIKNAKTNLDAITAPAKEELAYTSAAPAAEPAYIRNLAPKIVSQPMSSPNQFGLNPKYSFATFIVGKANELARAAASAVTANPGTNYNPLFIYGGAGLGKTHLIQAIGNEIISLNPKQKVLYITCEKFTNDFINSVQMNKAHNFKDVYRNVDVLLIDDIQFIAGKEGTQEEFFHTFNALHQNNKQIVLTSDRPPKSIPALENRLMTRFEGGMIADISQPDLETRRAILQSKLKEKNFYLEDAIISYIAATISNSIRELEGALNRIIAFSQLNYEKPSLDGVKKILSSLATNMQKKSVTPKDIIMTVSSFYDVPLEDISGKCREKKMVVPRQIIMYLLRSEIKSSYPAIGQELGGRDHTTAMHAVGKITRDYENDEKTRREIEQIKQRLYAL